MIYFALQNFTINKEFPTNLRPSRRWGFFYVRNDSLLYYISRGFNIEICIKILPEKGSNSRVRKCMAYIAEGKRGGGTL